MLSFDSGLANSLKLKSSSAFYIIKLYYNDESSFIGVSDKHRPDGADTYYGLILSWPSLHQSLDFFNFTTSISNGNLKLTNAARSYKDGRFSDQFSSYNFANRKWELFLNTENVSTYDTAARMVGTGQISGEIKYDQNELTFILLDYTGKFHKQIPVNVVDSTNYDQAPEKNVNKPQPICMGDFQTWPDGTPPAAGARFDRHFTLAKFPAIVVNEWDKTNARIEARLDGEDVHTLDTDQIYFYNNEFYIACDSGNTTEDEAAGAGSGQVTIKGNSWRIYIPLKSHNTYEAADADYVNTIDNDFDTKLTFTVIQANAGSQGWRIPKIPKLGELVNGSAGISIIVQFANFSAVAPATGFGIGHTVDTIRSNVTWGAGNENQTVAFDGAWYGGAAEDEWDLEGTLFLVIDDTGDAGQPTYSVDIHEIGLEITFRPDANKIHKVEIPAQYETEMKTWAMGNLTGQYGVYTVEKEMLVKKAETILTPAFSDYLYASGLGRKYGAWIDTINGNARNDENGASADPGYNAGACIENPIYQMENIMRTDLGLDSGVDGSDIDIESFDKSGNTTDGYITDSFDDAVADIKFAWSQLNFINSKRLFEKMGKQCFTWIFISGDGKFHAVTRRKPADYTASDKTVDFRDVDFDKLSLTPLNQVRNEIKVNYKFDYGQNQTLDQKEPATNPDVASSGTGVSGYNQTLILEMDADLIQDETTAGNLAESLQDMFKDRFIIIKFSTSRMKYADLEIGDIIDWSNWPSDLKLYGTAMAATNFFMVTDIDKSLTKISMTVIEVSD